MAEKREKKNQTFFFFFFKQNRELQVGLWVERSLGTEQKIETPLMKQDLGRVNQEWNERSDEQKNKDSSSQMQNKVLMSKDTDKFGDTEEGSRGVTPDSLSVLSSRR